MYFVLPLIYRFIVDVCILFIYFYLSIIIFSMIPINNLSVVSVRAIGLAAFIAGFAFFSNNLVFHVFHVSGVIAASLTSFNA